MNSEKSQHQADPGLTGSRFLFWSCAPVLILTAVLFPFLIPNQTLTSVIASTLISVWCVLLSLLLFDPARFRWAGRLAALMVFIIYVAYVINMLVSGAPMWGNRRSMSVMTSVVGLSVIGVPALYFALFGRLGRDVYAESESVEEDDSDDDDDENGDVAWPAAVASIQDERNA